MPSRTAVRKNSTPLESADFEIEALRIFIRMPDGKWQRGMRKRAMVKSKKAALRLLNAIASRVVRPE